MPIQISSFNNTCTPLLPKKFSTPMGETLMGRHGKKYLELSQGEKKATPKPPLVMASRILCDAVHKVKYAINTKPVFCLKYDL